MEVKLNRTPTYRGPAEGCGHGRLRRAGIQRFPFPPYRVHLLTCEECRTTLSTLTLRAGNPASEDPKGKRNSAA